jgi:hypothetical protein
LKTLTQYGIPVKTTTLHDSDFVNRMQPIKLTKRKKNLEQ